MVACRHRYIFPKELSVQSSVFHSLEKIEPLAQSPPHTLLQLIKESVTQTTVTASMLVAAGEYLMFDEFDVF